MRFSLLRSHQAMHFILGTSPSLQSSHGYSPLKFLLVLNFFAVSAAPRRPAGFFQIPAAHSSNHHQEFRAAPGYVNNASASNDFV